MAFAKGFDLLRCALPLQLNTKVRISTVFESKGSENKKERQQMLRSCKKSPDCYYEGSKKTCCVGVFTPRNH